LTLYRNKYRIETTRLQGYDYSQTGAYFVTIVTKNREHYFGKKINGIIELSEIGEIVKKEWLNTAKIRKYVQLGEWVIMPNHFHAIVIIQNVETSRRGVSTINEQNKYQNSQWKTGSLGAIINQFKSICTKQIRKISPNFAWQSRYYDHIIRNENEFQKISEYIINNPLNWKNDEHFSD